MTATHRTPYDLESSHEALSVRAPRHLAVPESRRDVTTDLYELGWGESFHFAPKRHGEGHAEALARHERDLADTLELRASMRVLDIGCGIGGPMREIARWSGASLVGINNDAYQIARGNLRTRKAGLSGLCTFERADFMAMPFEDATFDAAYAIESGYQASDRTQMFREVLRVLKPGAHFAGFDWCLTEKYDDGDPEHRRVKATIESAQGRPGIARSKEIEQALFDAGFGLIDAHDMAVASIRELPWYFALSGRGGSFPALYRTPRGRRLAAMALRLMEYVHLVRAGACDASRALNAEADALVEGGEQGIFTPLYFFHAVKRC